MNIDQRSQNKSEVDWDFVDDLYLEGVKWYEIGAYLFKNKMGQYKPESLGLFQESNTNKADTNDKQDANNNNLIEVMNREIRSGILLVKNSDTPIQDSTNKESRKEDLEIDPEANVDNYETNNNL